MTKIFYDTEFYEDGKTIDFISIGMAKENYETFYEVSKEFDFDKIWDSEDTFVKDNVLAPILFDFSMNDFYGTYVCEDWYYKGDLVDLKIFKEHFMKQENKQFLKELINKFGKTKEEIKNQIISFTKGEKIELYGYYSSYDHVVLAQLFGRMIDLPKNFPMYTIDLKQFIDDKGRQLKEKEYHGFLKQDSKYPKQDKEHIALSDALWNKELYNFLKF